MLQDVAEELKALTAVDIDGFKKRVRALLYVARYQGHFHPSAHDKEEVGDIVAVLAKEAKKGIVAEKMAGVMAAALRDDFGWREKAMEVLEELQAAGGPRVPLSAEIGM